MSLRPQSLASGSRGDCGCRARRLSQRQPLWTCVRNMARSTMISSFLISSRPKGVLWRWRSGAWRRDTVYGRADRSAGGRCRPALYQLEICLSLRLASPGFDFTLLHDFRQRLLAHEAAQRLLDTFLAACKAHGWIKAKARGTNGPIRRLSWRRPAPSIAWNASWKPCIGP